MPIYTKTGDKGETSLVGGKRVSKADPRIELYGSVDELNSWLGTFRDPHLTEIQGDLMLIGSVLAGWDGDLSGLDSRITEMERWIDAFDATMPKLTHFVLPRGRMQIARAVARRVERLAVKGHTDPIIIRYFNRLSDLLFTKARYINKRQKVAEVTWSGTQYPRKHRG